MDDPARKVVAKGAAPFPNHSHIDSDLDSSMFRSFEYRFRRFDGRQRRGFPILSVRRLWHVDPCLVGVWPSMLCAHSQNVNSEFDIEHV